MVKAPALPPRSAEVEAGLDEAAAAVRGAGQLLAVCHVSPDGDALGSILGLANALGPHTKIAVGWGEDRPEVARQYRFLPGWELIAPPDRLPDCDVVLALDCASADRLGTLQERVLKAPVVVNLDHHVSNTRFGTINVVDDRAASTCELVLDLLVRLGADITLEVATCLYTGLVTDTGRFSYASVTPRTHEVAAALVSRGVQVDIIARTVFESLPYGYLKLLGCVLERCRLLEDPAVVVSYVSQEDLSRWTVSMEETEELINSLRSVRESDVAAILKEQPGGSWKGSLRSKGATDVSEVAASFGGGGHRLAAGFTSEYGLEETISRLHEVLRLR
ncbi:MAG TPA: bifunctional oligoribonuclease/PAP phosphatase NrnA [Actinomycetota bacterium]|nr:bifunctional oligoribonuclease/PAP phosphatase NrnA [Actinomycetota bacterium]